MRDGRIGIHVLLVGMDELPILGNKPLMAQNTCFGRRRFHHFAGQL
jgi:hypothetical protein